MGRKRPISGRSGERIPSRAYSKKISQRGHKPNKRSSLNQRQRLIIILSAVIFIIAVAGISMIFAKNGSEVFVAEKSVGFIKDKKITAEDISKNVTAQLVSQRGTNIELSEEITIKGCRVKKKDNPLATDNMIAKIRDMISYKIEAAVISADGNVVAILNNAEDANNLLQEIRNEYIPEGTENIEAVFVQEVSVNTGFYNSDEIISVEEARKKFTEGTVSQQPYTIKTGDTIFKIAASSNMSVEDLLLVNPGLSVDSVIRVGQQLNINVVTPFISVKTLETQVFTEKQPKEIQYQQDSTKPKTYKKVIQQGKDGQREVTVQIVRVNGFEQEQKNISEKTIVEPVAEIIVVGTK